MVKNGGSLLGRFLLNIADLYIAQNLEPHGFKVVKISGQLKAGAGHILNGQSDGFVIC